MGGSGSGRQAAPELPYGKYVCGMMLKNTKCKEDQGNQGMKLHKLSFLFTYHIFRTGDGFSHHVVTIIGLRPMDS
jgi:hypothetical protein